MTFKIRYIGYMIMLSGLVLSCGKKHEKQAQTQKERQDSLRQVRKQRMQRQRQDSLAKVRQDSMAKMQRENKKRQAMTSLGTNGSYTLQVGSWRSKVKAEKRSQAWKDRGFDHAFVVQYGNEENGDLWYRVRLGKAGSRQQAKKIQQQIQQKYQAKAWIDNGNG